MEKIIKLENYDYIDEIKQDYPQYSVINLYKDDLASSFETIFSNDLFTINNNYLVVDYDRLYTKYNKELTKLFASKAINVILVVDYLINPEYVNEYSGVIYEEKNYHLKTMLQHFIKINNINIDNDTLDILIFNLEENYSLIKQELIKLSIVDDNITSDIISKYSYKLAKSSAFEFVKLVVLNKITDANTIAENLLENDFSEVSLLIFTARNVQSLLMCKLLLEKKYSKKVIMETLKVSEFKYKQMLDLVKLTHLKTLYRLLIKLNQLDVQLKGL